MIRYLCFAFVLFSGIGCTWAAATAATAGVTESKFKETTVFPEDGNVTVADEHLMDGNETFLTTESTRSPKSDEDDDYLPVLDSEEALINAFKLQMLIAAEKRQTTRTVPNRQCGRRLSRAARIIGGKNTYAGEFPWVASVRVLSTHYCGGTIINKNWVLTAAHCAKRNLKDTYPNWYAARYFRVRPGDNSVNVKGYRSDLDIYVDEVVIHPNFGNPHRYSNDLVLLKLKKPLEFNTLVQPICLPDPAKDYAGYTGTVVGWGAMKENDTDRAKVLQKVVVPILNNTQCGEWYTDVYNGFVQIYDYQICAGLKAGGKDACQGDSGGPLVVRVDGHFTAVGIVSSGVGCGREHLPGIYSRLTAYIPWIKRVTGG